MSTLVIVMQKVGPELFTLDRQPLTTSLDILTMRYNKEKKS